MFSSAAGFRINEDANKTPATAATVTPELLRVCRPTAAAAGGGTRKEQPDGGCSG